MSALPCSRQRWPTPLRHFPTCPAAVRPPIASHQLASHSSRCARGFCGALYAAGGALVRGGPGRYRTARVRRRAATSVPCRPVPSVGLTVETAPQWSRNDAPIRLDLSQPTVNSEARADVQTASRYLSRHSWQPCTAAQPGRRDRDISTCARHPACKHAVRCAKDRRKPARLARDVNWTRCEPSRAKVWIKAYQDGAPSGLEDSLDEGTGAVDAAGV